jgi:hypothetical protein
MNPALNPIVNDVAELRVAMTVAEAPRPVEPQAGLMLRATPAPRARKLADLQRPLQNDPSALIKHRFLCRRAALLLVGATGLGKSSLSMQLMIKWAVGQPVFGLEPVKPLRSLLVQAENDDGDL